MALQRSEIVTIFGVIGAVALAFHVGIFQWNHPSRKKFPIFGVDVSHHQGVIDWRKAKEGGVQFAYIKATEGGDFKDSKFLDNWIECKYADVPRGAYHFFSFCRPGLVQAQNFLQAVPLEPQTLPPALDLEFGDNCGGVPTQAEMEKEVSAFVAGISGRFSGPPIFYVTSEFYKRYLASGHSKFPPHRLWIRNLLREPPQEPMKEWTLWQYASRGRVTGIPHVVDLDVYAGNAEQFAAIIYPDNSIPSAQAR